MDTRAEMGRNRPQPKIKFASPEAWAIKLIQIMWTNVILIWEIRNTTIQQHYTEKGLKRAHELMVQAAERQT